MGLNQFHLNVIATTNRVAEFVVSWLIVKKDLPYAILGTFFKIFRNYS